MKTITYDGYNNLWLKGIAMTVTTETPRSAFRHLDTKLIEIYETDTDQRNG